MSARTLFAAALIGMLAFAPYRPAVAGPADAERVVQKDDEPVVPGTRKPTEAERKAASTSIEAQLKAFKADDYQAAMKYQSAALRENFESVEQFRQTIKRGYPQFASYKSVTFGEAACDKAGDRLAIQITLTGQDGVIVRALYTMLREQGEYKVDGVYPTAKPKTAPRDEV
jgi:uncharacterized protein DUF4864